VGCGIKCRKFRDEDSICFQEQATKEITPGNPVVAQQQSEDPHAKVIRDSRYQYLTLPGRNTSFSPLVIKF
jgi:hypothetical protein